MEMHLPSLWAINFHSSGYERESKRQWAGGLVRSTEGRAFIKHVPADAAAAANKNQA
jgi:hypothetical protein